MDGQLDTMEALAAWFDWASAGALSSETLKGYGRELMAFFLATHLSWDDVTLTVLTAYSATLSPGRSRIAYAALRNFQRWMRVSGISTHDPGLDLMPYQKQKRRVPTAFSHDELIKLRAAAEDLGPRHAAITNILYLTGLRAKELGGAMFEDIVEAGIVVRVTKAKPGSSERERVVPLGQQARARIDQLHIHRPLRDNGTITGVGYVPMWRMIKEVGLKSGVTDVHPHKFRATFCTHLMQKGVDVRTISELAGHSSIATTMAYLATDDQRKVEAVALLA